MRGAGSPGGEYGTRSLGSSGGGGWDGRDTGCGVPGLGEDGWDAASGELPPDHSHLRLSIRPFIPVPRGALRAHILGFLSNLGDSECEQNTLVLCFDSLLTSGKQSYSADNFFNSFCSPGPPLSLSASLSGQMRQMPSYPLLNTQEKKAKKP